MHKGSFKAMVVTETPDHGFRRSIQEKPFQALPEGEVLIRVRYSSLNYKDALSATGNKGVTRAYPHVPGIDAAGTVEESTSPAFSPGMEVIVTGYDFGSHRDGGWGEYAHAPADWVVKKPDGLSLYESMILGTAGFTAALSVSKLIHHGVTPSQGPVLVTGSTGGVGSIAVTILAALGFHVVAVTGKTSAYDFLRQLGAQEIITREEAIDGSRKPLLGGRWGGVVDTVGGPMLATAIRQTNLEGAVACCGNIGSAAMEVSIYPFILRGVALLGIGSAFTPMKTRLRIWEMLGGDWKLRHPEALAHCTVLEEAGGPLVDRILRGELHGRVVIDMQPSSPHSAPV